MISLIRRVLTKIDTVLPSALIVHAVLVAILGAVFTLVLLQFTNSRVDRLQRQVNFLTAVNQKMVEIMLEASTPSATPVETPSPTPLVKSKTKTATSSGGLK